MRILFIGDLSSYSRARQRFEAIQDLGYVTQACIWEPLETVANNHRPSLWYRICFKLGYPLDLVGLNQSLLPTIENFQPDLIWVEKATTIFPKTYCQIKAKFPKLKIIYFSEDDIFVRNNRSKYLRNSLSLFDIVFTTKLRNLNELPSLGAKKTYFVYQTYDPKFHKPVQMSKEEMETWGADVSFIGTFERDRAEKMLYLAENDIKVRIWGDNWHRWNVRHQNLLIEGKAALNDQFIKVINSSKINLNFLRKLNRDQHTSRSLEIPASGGFMLAERTDEHLHLFIEGKEAAFFDSSEELLAQVKYYLSHESERNTIALAGRKRCLESKYSHHEQVKSILETVSNFNSQERELAK